MASSNHSDKGTDPSPIHPGYGRVLSAEQVAQYHEVGYIALHSLIDVGEIACLRAIYDRLFADRVGRSEGNHLDLAGTDEDGQELNLPQILQPSKYAPEFLESHTMALVRTILTELLGPTASVTFDHAINKPPVHGAETPWHQDEAYWDPSYVYRSLSVWIPLQDATVDNGCMHFIPSSHKPCVVPHRPIGGDPRVHGLEALPGSIDVSTAVACPLPAGGATIHDSKTLHYTSMNRSNDHRRAYIVAGGTPKEPATRPREFPWRLAQRTSTARARRAKARTDDVVP